jgi:YD repeat-containing protein
MPIEWSRFYASDVTMNSALGQGWVLPWEQSLRCTGKRLYLTDNQGRTVPFVNLQPGQRIYNAHEQVYLVRITQVTDALDRTAEFHYNKDHRVTASRDFGGEHYRFDLDAHGNMTGIELPDGNRVAMQYDEFSRLSEEVDQIGRKIAYQYYFNTTQVTQVTYPDGSTWKASYDDRGTLLAEYDALGQRTEYFHGDDGLPHTIVDATEKSKHLCGTHLGRLRSFRTVPEKRPRIGMTTETTWRR